MSIWSYNILKADFPVTTEFLTLNEGNTPVDRIMDEEREIFIKREDKNPSGSWKDRGTAFKLTELTSQNISEAVLFSSGNALISLLTYCKETRVDLKINAVVSSKINTNKLHLLEELIENSNHSLIISDAPKKEAIRIAADKKIPNLRISIDNNIVKGYWTLGFELYSILKKSGDFEVNLFCQASSGTAVVGLAEGLLMKSGSEFKMPRIYICQTESVHSFSSSSGSDTNTLDKVEEKGVVSIADAIVDTVGLRGSQIKKIVNETGGEVYAISNVELENAKEFMNKKNINDLSYNSLLSVAGYLRNRAGSINICIASGR